MKRIPLILICFLLLGTHSGFAQTFLQWDVPYYTQVYYRNWSTACMPTSAAMVVNYFYGNSFVWSGVTWDEYPLDSPYRTNGQRLYAKGMITGQEGVQIPLEDYLQKWPKNGFRQFYGAWTTELGPERDEKYTTSTTYVPPGGTETQTSKSTDGVVMGDTYGTRAAMEKILDKYGLHHEFLSSANFDADDLRAAVARGPVIISTDYDGPGDDWEGHIVVVIGTTTDGKFIVNDPWGNTFVDQSPSDDGAAVEYTFDFLGMSYRWGGILIPIEENINPHHPDHDGFSRYDLFCGSDLNFDYNGAGIQDVNYDGDGEHEFPIGFAYQAFDTQEHEITNTEGWEYYYSTAYGAFLVCETSGDVDLVTNSATWESTARIDGRYKLEAGFYAGSLNAAQVPYKIYVDDVLRYVETLDQSQIAPDEVGFCWKTLHQGLALREDQKLTIEVLNNTGDPNDPKEINVDMVNASYLGFIDLDEVGSYADGWHDDGSSQAILDAWLRNGGHEALGDPVDAGGDGTRVHAYAFATLDGANSQVFLQDFAHPQTGAVTTIAYDPQTQSASLLQGCLGYLWWQPVVGLGDPDTRYQSVLGAPLSDEIDDTAQFPDAEREEGFVVMQNFEHGRMFWQDGTVRVKKNDGETCDDFCGDIDICSSGKSSGLAFRKAEQTCAVLLGGGDEESDIWDFDEAGTLGWTARNATDLGIDHTVWELDPYPDSSLMSGIVSPAGLSAVHTDHYTGVEVRVAVFGQHPGILAAHVKIDGLWQAPIAMSYYFGDSSPSRQCVYRGDIPYEGQIQQLRIDFVWGSETEYDRVDVDYVRFLPVLLGDEIFVSPAGSDQPTGGGAGSPCRTIQYALDRAPEHATVHVAAGVYEENLDFNFGNVALIGAGRESTTIDGGQNGAAVTIAGFQDSATVLRGFTIRNGGNPAGNGIGGGVSCSGTSPRIVACLITQNSAVRGSGVYLAGANASVDSCIVTDNSAFWSAKDSARRIASRGGGVYCTGGSPTLSHLIVSYNTSDFGGGVTCTLGSSPTIYNCLIYGNTANIQGGGVGLESAGETVSLENCTVFGNHSEWGSGGGLSIEGGTLYAVNGIFWNNSPAEFALGSGALSITYSDIAGGYNGTGNIDADPLFQNAALGDFALQPSSPCIDTGDPASPVDADGSRADMGATGGCTPGLVINEFLALNTTGLQDEAGHCEDWIEIWNSSACPVGLGGLFLTNDAADPELWALPDTVLGANSYLVLWCDADPAAGTLHTNFLLDESGGYVGISDAGYAKTATIDSHTYGVQTADVSEGRVGDGSGAWTFYPDPSPGVSNQVAATVASDRLPAHYTLHPCVPNPFNPQTVISYDLPRRVRVQLQVYDIAGRLVKTLVDGEVAAGRQRAVWRGDDERGRRVGSGVYFYRLRADGFVQTRKMLLMK